MPPLLREAVADLVLLDHAFPHCAAAEPLGPGGLGERFAAMHACFRAARLPADCSAYAASPPRLRS